MTLPPFFLFDVGSGNRRLINDEVAVGNDVQIKMEVVLVKTNAPKGIRTSVSVCTIFQPRYPSFVWPGGSKQDS